MYSIIADLAHQHQDEILKSVIAQIRVSHMDFYAQQPDSLLMERFGTTLATQLNYLATGDLSIWKNFCAEIVTKRVREGIKYTDLIEISRLLLAEIQQLYRQELLPLGTLDGQDTAKIDSWLESRINGMNAVAISTATATAMRVAREMRQHNQIAS